MKEKAKRQKHFVEERCFHTKPLEESQTAEGLTHQIQAHYVSQWKTKIFHSYQFYVQSVYGGKVASLPPQMCIISAKNRTYFKKNQHCKIQG